ncbi:hypothetical protein BDB01DRAFT_846110 [Pilobolus umbonatus]|nr:hypothetical protein BDB01DRAFT_846110 [Pilobolus umbonatus]
MRTYEDAILNEADMLVEKINKMNNTIRSMNDTSIIQLIEQMRRLEKKMSLVFTFFKASMFTNTLYDSQGETNRPPIVHD